MLKSARPAVCSTLMAYPFHFISVLFWGWCPRSNRRNIIKHRSMANRWCTPMRPDIFYGFIMPDVISEKVEDEIPFFMIIFINKQAGIWSIRFATGTFPQSHGSSSVISHRFVHFYLHGSRNSWLPGICWYAFYWQVDIYLIHVSSWTINFYHCILILFSRQYPHKLCAFLCHWPDENGISTFNYFELPVVCFAMQDKFPFISIWKSKSYICIIVF